MGEKYIDVHRYIVKVSVVLIQINLLSRNGNGKNFTKYFLCVLFHFTQKLVKQTKTYNTHTYTEMGEIKTRI